VKNRIGFILLTLLLWSLNGASANKVFAFSEVSQNLDSRNYDYLQADQNKQAVLLSEIISSENSISEEKQIGFFGYLASSGIFQKEPIASFPKNSFFSFLDRKKVIFQFLYPFHFFW